MRLSLSSVFQDDSASHVGGSVSDGIDHHQRRAALNIRRIRDADLELVDSRQELVDLQVELEIEADVGVGNAPVAREGVAALARQAPFRQLLQWWVQGAHLPMGTLPSLSMTWPLSQLRQ